MVQKHREYIRSPSGRWLRYRLHEPVGKKCFCPCSLDEVCHVDEVLKVMDDEQKAKSQDNRLPDLGGMSLAEVGLALKSHLSCTEKRSSSAGDEFRFASQPPRAGGGGCRRTFSPFRSRLAPQRLKYRSHWKQEELNLARPKGRSDS